MSIYNGLDEYGNNAARPIWHQGAGSTLKRTHKRCRAALGETETPRESLRAQAIEKRVLGQASVIFEGVYCRRDLIDIEQHPKPGRFLYGTIGPNQPDAGRRVVVDERRTDGLIWRPV